MKKIYLDKIRSPIILNVVHEYFGDYNELLYLRARYYLPSLGRFFTKDPWTGNIERPLSLNPWNYVEGNPIHRADPSGKCWYGDPLTKEIKINPFEGNPSEPCKSFANMMNEANVNVATPQTWLNSLPEEVKSYFLSCKREIPIVILTTPYNPNIIGPESDKGRFMKSRLVYGPEKYMAASGTVTENTDTNGAVGTLTVRFKYRASYIIKIYEKAVDLIVGQWYSDLTPKVPHTAGASLGITYQNGKRSSKGLGQLGTGNNISATTQFSFYGKNNFPIKLLIDIYFGPADAELYSPFNTHQVYKFPVNPSEIY